MPVVITMTCEPTSVFGSGRIYDYSGYDRILRNRRLIYVNTKPTVDVSYNKTPKHLM